MNRRRVVGRGAGLVAVALLHLPLSAQSDWRLHEELRIGALDGPTSITSVGAVVQSADGRMVYVSQPDDRTIRVFDAVTGAPGGLLGRGGRGPGEFERIGGLSIRGDTLFVADPLQQRMVTFSGGGAHIETFKVLARPHPTTRRPPLPFKAAPSGNIWGQFVLNAASIARGDVTASPMVIMSRDGEVLREVAALPLAGATTLAEFSGLVVVFIQPFLDTYHLWDVAADGSAAALVSATAEQQAEGTFSVTRFAASGDTVFHRAFVYTPIPVPRTVRDSIWSDFASGMFSRAGRRAMDLAREHVVIPETHPPVTDVVADGSGRTWLRREEAGPMVTWVALNDRGAIEARIETPRALEVHHISGDVFWGVILDEVDVPYVVRFRLTSER